MRFMVRRRSFLVATIFGCSLLLASCNSSPKGIRVGSKDFTEQLILGEMYALLLEAAGLPVERRLNLGGTPLAQQGLLQGEIDLYPEYTGTGLLTVLKESPTPFLATTAQDTRRNIYEAVRQGYQEKFALIWLDPAPLNNTFALTMTQEKAQALGINTLSELWAKAQNLVLVGPPEFEVREDGLPGLEAVYGAFPFKAYKPVDPGLRYQAIRNQEADVVVSFTTDGEIKSLNLKTLEDDRQFFPPYQVAPVVRQQLLDQYPQVADILNQLAPRLTDEAMQGLNNQVNGQGQEPAEVARSFLENQGLLD